MNYRREVDGLRALAVLPVILFHAGFSTFSGGFVGVDVFFVISGYLITSIILAEKQAGTFTLFNFWERRARRILPALFFVMFACLPVAWLWLLPEDLKSFSQGLVAVAAFASNIWFNMASGYFSPTSEQDPLLHTWSLAVEEQYYLFFPAFLMLTWRLGKRSVISILVIIAVLSLAAAQWGSLVDPTAAFYLLPTRAWELLIGVFVAFYASSDRTQQPGRMAGEIGGAVGLLLLIYAILAFDNQTPFPSVYTLVPTIGAALIILFASRETVVGKLLGYKLLVGIGLISYSAYLWHQPLFAFARQRSLYEPSQALFGSLALAAIVLAYFSWKYVERPFRNRQHFSRRAIFTYGATGSALLIATGLSGHLTKGYPNRMPASARIKGIGFPKIDNGWCFYSVDTIKSLPLGTKGLECWLGDKTAQIKGVLFGDSFAGHYEPLWNKAGLDAKADINAVTTNWCYPSMNEDFTGPKSSRAFEQCLFNRKYIVNNIENYDFAVLGSSWGAVLSQGKMDGVFEFIDYIAPKVRTVVVMASPKQFDLNITSSYRKGILHSGTFDISKVSTLRDKAQADGNRMLAEYSKKYDNVIFIDRDSLFLVDGKPSDVTAEGIPYSWEGSHLSIYGSTSAADTFLASHKYASFKERVHNTVAAD